MTPKPPAVLPGRPTIKMIATLARVAPSTVSRAINHDPSISLRTRARIQRIAARVGFVPNVTARGLVTRRSDVVALVLGPSQNPFYLEMIPLITERLALRGKPLMIVRMRETDRIEATLATLARHQVSGCLIGAASMTPEAVALCRRFDIPTVMVNRLANVEGSFVSCNNHEAGLQVASLFAAEGRRCIVYVGAEPGKATVQDEQREAGLRDGALGVGLTAPQRFATVYSYEGGLAAARALLGQLPGADGIFVANDIVAFGVLDGLRRAGAVVPGQMSVVGFDDLPQACWLGYGLTTVRQPMETIVEQALGILDRQISEPGAPAEGVYVSAELVRRATTLGMPASPT